MIDPRYNLLSASLNTLIDDIGDSFANDKLEKHEIIFTAKNMFTSFNYFTIHEVSVEVDGYYDHNDDWIENGDSTIHYLEEHHFDSVFGEDAIVDPTNAIKLTNSNMDMVLSLAEKLVENKTLHGYGLLITDEKENFMNPLHPLAVEHMKENGIPFNNNFTIILFMMEESIKIDTSDIVYKIIKENINNILSHVAEEKKRYRK